jgi:hypothetical protein
MIATLMTPFKFEVCSPIQLQSSYLTGTRVVSTAGRKLKQLASALHVEVSNSTPS